MLGVHINPMVDFREHFLYITKDVKKLARALTKRKLSPPLKSMAIELLLKSKCHATHLEVFNERQLTNIDGILNKAMRQALGLLPKFPTKGVQRPLKETGLGLPPMRNRDTQMVIEHLTRLMTKDTKRGFTAHAHVHRLLSHFNHWPQEVKRHWSTNPLSSPHSASLGSLAAYPDWNTIAYHPSNTIMTSPQVSGNHRERSTTLVKKSVPHYKDK